MAILKETGGRMSCAVLAMLLLGVTMYNGVVGETCIGFATDGYYDFSDSVGRIATADFQFIDSVTGDTSTRSIYMSFCESVDVLFFPSEQNDPNNKEAWLGFNHGVSQGISALTTPAPALIFHNNFINGDQGPPCSNIAGHRAAQISIYCTEGGKNTCPLGACDMEGEDSSFCICAQPAYSSSKPCDILIDLSMDCPSITPHVTPPSPEPTNPDDCATDGEIFGIVLGTFLAVLLILWIAKWIINMFVLGLSGTAALPGVDGCQDRSSVYETVA